ncbi:hypothetical protein CPAR01_09810 [Colletotrichum paranaense]|uniref:Uncharacterized protein n=2 Tax=Colletotrichum acutatum species complex TaxID=2707335 RepID=A0ABQ9PEN1_9PEZI|nr:uncharacterized protein CPAR01_09810 [Colletotrichum paranaense]KAK0370517.1 hypothetical protein CLIM01_12123 [Colletotrichum limetticola]KAK1536268.1 hypothetical protein CPAR01_09810 [Colletotrichum paranaense]
MPAPRRWCFSQAARQPDEARRAKRRFWIRPVVVRFGDRHPFPLAAVSMSHTLRVPGEGFATPVFKLDASDPDVSQPTAAEEHSALGLTGRGALPNHQC